MIRTGARHRHRAGVRRELLLFYGAAALALIVVSIGAVVASKSVARSQALQDAQRMTVRLGNLVVAPLLADALDGDAERLDELNSALEHRMRDGYLSLVTVWDADGRVVFSTEAEEVGRTLERPPRSPRRYPTASSARTSRKNPKPATWSSSGPIPDLSRCTRR